MKKITFYKKYQDKFSIFILLGLFIAIVAITGFIAFSRKIAKPQDVLYVKIKISQGLWWAASYNPPLWLAQSIKTDDTEKDLFGNEIATVLDRVYYPSDPIKSPNQYDVYVTLKLATKQDRGTEKYRYKRNILAVGSPINVDLSATTVTGSIIEMSQSPIKSEYFTKTITLFNQYGYYADSPSEYDMVTIGDKYFDGENDAVTITKKYLGPRLVAFSDAAGKSVVNQLRVNQNIYIEAEIKVKEVDGMLFFGEEQRITPGSSLNILTNSQDLTKFTIVSIK